MAKTFAERQEAGLSHREEKELEAGTLSNLVDITRNDGTYNVKLLGSVRRWSQMFIPILRQDPDSGEEEESFTVFNLGRADNLLTHWLSLERDLRYDFFREYYARLGKSEVTDELLRRKARPQISPKRTIAFYGFDLDDPKPKVKVIVVPMGVFDPRKGEGIRQLQAKVNSRNPGKLHWGPLPSLDLMITRETDSKAKVAARWMATSYSVQVDNAPLKGKVDVGVLEESLDMKMFQRCLTEEQMESIQQELEIDIDELVEPASEEDIKQRLTTTPVNLGAVRDDFPMFVQPKAVADLFDKNDYGDCYVLPPAIIAQTDRMLAEGGSVEGEYEDVARPNAPSIKGNVEEDTSEDVSEVEDVEDDTGAEDAVEEESAAKSSKAKTKKSSGQSKRGGW